MDRDIYERAERAAFSVAQTTLKEFREGRELYPTKSDEDQLRSETDDYGGGEARV